MRFLNNMKIKKKSKRKKGLRLPKITLKKPLKAVGKAFDTAGQVVDHVADEIGEKLEPVGDAVGKVTTPVGDTVGKVAKPVGEALAPVAEAVDHVEHFLKTGDFGKQVEKLLAEQDEVKAELQHETYLLHEDSAILVRAQTRYHALAQIDGQMRGHRDGIGEVRPRIDLTKVEYDLYENAGTRALERIGLEPVAEGLKFVREITYLMPNELMYKQVELATVRKALRENIARCEDSTDELKASRLRIQNHTKVIRQKIRELEESFAVANIDISPTSALERDVQAIEDKASRTLARTLLAGDHAPEMIAQITGLSLEEISELESAQ